MSQNTAFFQNPVLGHPAGLFVLFFTEMWERFSYYGMRATCFVLTSLAKGAGHIEDAMALYGTYTMWVYFTPVVGIPGGSLRVSLGCCARCFGNDFGPHRWQSNFYILDWVSYYREWFV
jgi:hypothetical protein